MTITTKAALDAAPKSRHSINYSSGVQQAVASSVRYQCVAMQSATGNQRGVVATPAAASSGGTLWSNGNAGFLLFPAADSVVYSVATSGAETSDGPARMALYDFVWGASGFVGNSGSAQAVTGFPALSRPDADGTGLELFLFVKTASSATSTGITVDYTNTAGTTGRTATLMLNGGVTTVLNTAGALLPFKLQDGDLGVKSIQGMTIAVSQAVAGALWLVLGKRVCTFTAQGADATGSVEADAFTLGLQPVPSDAALAVVGLVSGFRYNGAVEISLAHG